ncbi:MAG: (2Fe-2S) ferredoxin domain-containing protein [Bacillota bacterium]
MKSLEELDKLREKLQQDLKIREKNQEVTVTVSMGTCGIAAGAREIVKALLEELKDHGLNGVALTQTNCVGLCQHEPLLEVKKGDEKTTYINVDREKAREIVKRHIAKGEVIKEWTNTN